MKVILQWSTLGLKLFVEKINKLYKSAGNIESILEWIYTHSEQY